MSFFWISFRIDEHDAGARTYQDRYSALQDAIDNARSGPAWAETTSFVVFESEEAIATIASTCKKAIAPSIDLFLIRNLDFKSAYICGKNLDQDIYKLMPYLREVP